MPPPFWILNFLNAISEKTIPKIVLFNQLIKFSLNPLQERQSFRQKFPKFSLRNSTGKKAFLNN
jgi:hypothetical protein